MHIPISVALFYYTYLRITLYPLQGLPSLIQRLRKDVVIPKNSAAFVMDENSVDTPVSFFTTQTARDLVPLKKKKRRRRILY